MREALGTQHYAIPTGASYVGWIKRHPREMGAPEIKGFLADLVVDRNVAASTRNQAPHAILFLCRDVLKEDLDNRAVDATCGPGNLSACPS